MTWNDAQTDRLRVLYADGCTCREIAAEIGGVTRNSVIGKIHRLGLAWRRVERAGKSRPGKSRRVDTARVKALKTVKSPVVNGSEQNRICRKMLLELKDDDCRFPFGDVGDADFFFCGAETVSPLPYCAEHCRVAYAGIPGRTARPYRRITYRHSKAHPA